MQFRVIRDNFPGFPEQARFEDKPEIKTAPDGSFQTPKELERKPREFRIEVAADGFFPARTAWVPVPAGDLLTLPDLTLKRSRGVRIVSGRVVDRDGKPLQGASVSRAGDGPRWTSARADADGRFRLHGVSGGAALVFADGAGIPVRGHDHRQWGRSRGDPPGPGERAADCDLEDTPVSAHQGRGAALARELLEPLLPLARSGSLGVVSSSVIPALARVDPAGVLDLIENRAVAGVSGTLIQVALGQYEDDPAAAIATIQDDLDPSSRTAAWLALEAFRPAVDRAPP